MSEDPQHDEAKVDAGPSVLEAFANLNFVTRTHTRKRTNTTIQHLPNELLFNIFSFLFISTPLELIHHQIYRASVVCKLWDSMIKTTPRFWTRLPKFGVPLSASQAFSGSEGEPEGIDKFATFNQHAALQQEVDPAARDSLRIGEAAVPILWACECIDGICVANANELPGEDYEDAVSGKYNEEMNEYGDEIDSVDVREGGEGDDLELLSSASEETSSLARWEQHSDSSESYVEHQGDNMLPYGMYREYLYALIRSLVRSYPLPVEAYLCLPPHQVFYCPSCGGQEAQMMHTFMHVFKRAKILSIDVHTSSMDYLESFMKGAPMIRSHNLPCVGIDEQDLPENLKRPLPPPPVSGRSPYYPYLEDLTIILSHSATPFSDDHSSYALLPPVFSQAKLNRLNLVNSTRVLPEYSGQYFPLYTDLFCKCDWGTLTDFEGVFNGMGDVRVVLAFARNLERAVFTVHLRNEEEIFPMMDRNEMDDSISAGRDDDPDMDIDTIHMSSLRALEIKLAQDSFKQLLNPIPVDVLSLDEVDGADFEGPGRALFHYVLSGVQVPLLEDLTLSAAFLQLNEDRSYACNQARSSLNSFFKSCHSSLRRLELEKLPSYMKGRGPRQMYTMGSRIPIFCQHLFEVIHVIHSTSISTSTSTLNSSPNSLSTSHTDTATCSLEEIVIHEKVSYIQFKKIFGILTGLFTLTDVDGVTSERELPLSLTKFTIAAIDGKDREDKWDGYYHVTGGDVVEDDD